MWGPLSRLSAWRVPPVYCYRRPGSDPGPNLVAGLRVPSPLGLSVRPTSATHPYQPECTPAKSALGVFIIPVQLGPVTEGHEQKS